MVDSGRAVIQKSGSEARISHMACNHLSKSWLNIFVTLHSADLRNLRNSQPPHLQPILLHSCAEKLSEPEPVELPRTAATQLDEETSLSLGFSV